MHGSRVEITNGSPFDAREWLRKEVLWASLMTPYGRQLTGWRDDTAIQQHHGNVSRQKLYGLSEDVELQSLAFFNQGKNVAGLISSVALFKVCTVGTGEGGYVNPLDVQAQSVDKVLTLATQTGITRPDEQEAYLQCSNLVKASFANPTEFSKRKRLLRASNILASVAAIEARGWLDDARQIEGEKLPKLTINDGGHPRSVGPRVEMLQPIFEKIVASEAYLSCQ